MGNKGLRPSGTRVLADSPEMLLIPSEGLLNCSIKPHRLPWLLQVSISALRKSAVTRTNMRKDSHLGHDDKSPRMPTSEEAEEGAYTL